jgi:uncharacterized protein YgbK (DUF1537 family)
VDYAAVSQGAAAIQAQFASLCREGYGFAVVDALTNSDLIEIAAACAALPLVTAGSGIAVGLPENFRKQGLLSKDMVADALPSTGGFRAVISGSCSVATRKQVAAMRDQHPSFRVDPLELVRGTDVAAQALQWASEHIAKAPVLIYATDEPEGVRAAQQQIGGQRAGELVEDALAAIAKGLVGFGVGQLIVAGGETAGAVVRALGVTGLRIGREIDPGVPWTTTLPLRAKTPPLALALKSGNFGTPDFFLKAWSCLQ